MQKAALRHAARTEEQIEDIKKRNKERQKKHAVIKKTANNVLNVAVNYEEVDFSKLQQYIAEINLNAMQAEAKVVAKQIAAIKKQEAALSDLIPDIHNWHKQFSMAELQQVHDAVKAKIDSWSALSLEQQAKKLHFEAYDFLGGNMKGVQQKYATWKVSQSAYIKELAAVNYKIDYNAQEVILDTVVKWSKAHPKSLKVKTLLDEALAEFAAKGDIAAIKSKVAAAKAEMNKRITEQSRRAAKKAIRNGGTVNFDADAYSKERKDNAVWCKSASESHNKWDAVSEAIWDNASDAERESWRAYTGGSGHMNRPLRGYENGWGWRHFKGVGNVPLNHENGEAHIRDLYTLIERCRSTEDIWLQRGIETWEGVEGLVGIKGLSKAQLKSMVGKEVVDWSFGSCGSAKGTGFSGTIFNIYCPKGSKLFYASTHSHFYYENETILQLGTRFRITKVEIAKNGNVYVDMEIIGYEKHPQL